MQAVNIINNLKKNHQNDTYSINSLVFIFNIKQSKIKGHKMHGEHFVE